MNELYKIAPLLTTHPASNPYTVPTGYFENQGIILFEKLGINPLHFIAPAIANTAVIHPYKTPPLYFESFASNLLNQMEQQAANDLPAGYFENLPDLLLSKIHGQQVTDELTEVAPFLNTISKKPIYFLPKNYFEELPLTNPMATSHKTKVIALHKKNNWLKYAVAASVVGILTLVGIKIMPTHSIQSIGASTVQIPVADTSLKAIDQSFAYLNDSDLENYLQQQDYNVGLNTVAYQAIQDEDIDVFLKEFSAEELQKHLAENISITQTN